MQILAKPGKGIFQKTKSPPGKTLHTKIWPKAVGDGIFCRFLKLQSMLIVRFPPIKLLQRVLSNAHDGISRVAVDWINMDVNVHFGDTMLNIGWIT